MADRQQGRDKSKSPTLANVLLVSCVSFIGGAEQSLLSLAESLKASGEFTPQISCPRGPLAKAARSRDIEVLRVPNMRTGSGVAVLGLMIMLLMFFILLWAIRVRNVKIVHANGLKAALPVVFAARCSGIPMVWHVRDYPARARLVRFVARNCSIIVVPSRFIQRALARITAPVTVPIRVIANGVEQPSGVDVKAAPIREHLGLSPDVMIVTMVAQLVPWKRHALFLEAAAMVSARNDNVRFVIVGSDPWGVHRSYVEGLKQRPTEGPLNGRVVFLGQRDDVLAIMKASDIVVLPSHHEPFGRVIVESWLARTPVVASNCGGPAEIVSHGETGLLFACGNAESLCQSMELLLSHPPLRGRLIAGGLKAASPYETSKHADAVAAVYREVLS